MALPKRARVMKRNRVRINMERQGRLLIRSLKSCLKLFFWPWGGVIRSLELKKVITNMPTPTMANRVMVKNQPLGSLASPLPNLETKGKVNPCTTNVAMVAVTKRTVEILVRSPISLVITPPNDAYGVLLKE